MAGNTVDFHLKIQVDGDGSLKTVQGELGDIDKISERINGQVEKFRSGLINLNQGVESLENIHNVIQQATQAMRNVTGIYEEQKVAETQLNTVMRQRMKSTDDEVKSVEGLCKAQQEEGVVAEEVSMAGAQQMATFLNNKKSLDTLIPAMTNLIAQQNGVNASQSDAVSIGNMMGKAMQGSTTVLQRVGITFTDAEQRMIKYGNESQRAATLAEVIKNNVGDMNSEIAKTDVGKAKNLEMGFEDVKKKIGETVIAYQPYLEIAGEGGEAILGLFRMVDATKAAAVALGLTNTVRGTHTALLDADTTAETANASGVATSNSIMTIHKTALAGLTAVTGSATVATVALTAAYTLGLSVAITAIITGLSALINKLSGTKKSEKENTDAVNEAKTAEENYKQSLEQTQAEMDVAITKLKDFKGNKKDEKKLVDDLNQKYGEAFGYYRSVSDWYKVLTANSNLYCQQMLNEIKIRDLANKAAKQQDVADKAKQYQVHLTHNMVDESGKHYQGETADDEKLNTAYDKHIQGLENAANQTIGQMNELVKANSKLSEQMKVNVPGTKRYNSATAATPTTKSGKKSSGRTSKSASSSDKPKTLIADPKNIAELNNNIDVYEEKLEKTNVTDTKSLGIYREKLKTLRDQVSTLEDGQKTEEAAPDTIDTGTVTTYKQLNDLVQKYQDRVDTTTGDVRAQAEAQIVKLNELKTKWDKALNPEKKPASVQELRTIQQLDDALTYYQNLQKTQTADELLETQKTIDAINRKKNAINGLLDIQAMQEETQQLGGLSEHDLKIRLQVIGMDGVKKSVAELNALLADTKNPLDAKQRKEAEGLLSTYKNYEATLKKSSVTFENVWGTIENVDNGFNTMTSAIKSNGNTWKKIQGIVNGALQTYNGIKEAISIMQSLGIITKSTAADTAVAGAMNVSTSNAEAAASENAAVADTADATAKTFKAHAGIPFVGIAIAAGLVATMFALISKSKSSVPKYANGGIAYGPTLGLFGEYDNASSNPEIVAPLDKLKNILSLQGGQTGGKVEFKIKGRDLYGVLRHENDVISRR